MSFQAIPPFRHNPLSLINLARLLGQGPQYLVRSVNFVQDISVYCLGENLPEFEGSQRLDRRSLSIISVSIDY